MKYIVFFLIITITGQVFGQNGAVESTQTDNVQEDSVQTSQSAINKTQIELKQEPKANNNKKLNASLSIGAETDFNEVSNQDKEYATSLGLKLGYQLNSEYKLSLSLEADKDLSDSYEEKLQSTDAKVSFSKSPIMLTKDLILAPSIGYIYPTTKKSKVRDGMLSAVEFNSAFVYQLSSAVSVTYMPRVRRYFHEYTTSRQNKSLSEYKGIQYFILDYNITDKIVFEPAFIYSKAWSYSGRQKDDSYMVAFELDYLYNEKTTIAWTNIFVRTLFFQNEIKGNISSFKPFI